MRQWILVIGALLWLAAPRQVSQAAETVTLDVVPTSITLTPGVPETALFVARNSLTSPLENLQLTAAADPRLAVWVDPPSTTTLAPGSSATWTAHISATDGLAGDRSLVFALSYRWRSAAASQPLDGNAIAALTIHPAAAESVGNIAGFEIKTALDQIQERQTGRLALVMQNRTNVPLSLLGLAIDVPLMHQGPGSGAAPIVRLSSSDPITGTIIPPQSQQIIAIDVDVNDQAPQGNHMLVFRADLGWQRDGRTFTGSLVATQQISIGVLGESAIRTVLGVPSFLLLPGVVMVASFMLLWRWKWPQRDLQLKSTSPDYWVIAIALSLLAAPFYAWITGLFGTRRDYLAGFSLLDVFLVWFGSLLVGALAWCVYYAVETGWNHFTLPSDRDDPIAVLNKMARNRNSYPPKQVKAILNGQPYPVFSIVPKPLAPAGAWIIPSVRLSWHTENIGLRIQVTKDLEEAERTENPICVAQVLKAHRGVLTAVWAKTKQLGAPQYIPNADSYCGAPMRFLEEEN